MKLPQKKSGESLLEVIIALGILMLIMGPAAGLFIGSTINTAMNRNELIGMGLAEEGINVMRHFRDTNFLRFSAKFVDCWNTKSEHSALAACEDPTNKIGAGSFRLAVDTLDFSWNLEAPLGPLSPQLNGQHDADYLLLLDPTSNLYNHSGGTSTPFYRSIEVAYPDPAMNVMRVTSRVLYRLGTKIHGITLSSLLTDTPL